MARLSSSPGGRASLALALTEGGAGAGAAPPALTGSRLVQWGGGEPAQG